MLKVIALRDSREMEQYHINCGDEVSIDVKGYRSVYLGKWESEENHLRGILLNPSKVVTHLAFNDLRNGKKQYSKFWSIYPHLTTPIIGDRHRYRRDKTSPLVYITGHQLATIRFGGGTDKVIHTAQIFNDAIRSGITEIVELMLSEGFNIHDSLNRRFMEKEEYQQHWTHPDDPDQLLGLDDWLATKLCKKSEGDDNKNLKDIVRLLLSKGYFFESIENHDKIIDSELRNLIKEGSSKLTKCETAVRAGDLDSIENLVKENPLPLYRIMDYLIRLKSNDVTAKHTEIVKWLCRQKEFIANINTHNAERTYIKNSTALTSTLDKGYGEWLMTFHRPGSYPEWANSSCSSQYAEWAKILLRSGAIGDFSDPVVAQVFLESFGVRRGGRMGDPLVNNDNGIDLELLALLLGKQEVTIKYGNASIEFRVEKGCLEITQH